ASQAEQMLARALLFPTLNAGFTYRLHSGTLLSSGTGRVVQTDMLQSLYSGLGAGVRATGTAPIPGVWLTFQVADAVYALRAADHFVASRRYDALAQRNAIPQEGAGRYLDLSAGAARLQAWRESLTEIAEVERLTADHARTGQGRQSDAERARA